MMDSAYFEKYFKDAIDAHNLVRPRRLELCNCINVKVLWDFNMRRLCIGYPGYLAYTFVLDACNNRDYKETYRSLFDEADGAIWNKIGNPIKTELLAHLRQLNELDGAFTKSAI